MFNAPRARGFSGAAQLGSWKKINATVERERTENDGMVLKDQTEWTSAFGVSKNGHKIFKKTLVAKWPTHTTKCPVQGWYRNFLMCKHFHELLVVVWKRKRESP